MFVIFSFVYFDLRAYDMLYCLYWKDFYEKDRINGGGGGEEVSHVFHRQMRFDIIEFLLCFIVVIALLLYNTWMRDGEHAMFITNQKVNLGL